jgi:16S rRNA U516 pseudouridylate synthase RsuA-like enzyme
MNFNLIEDCLVDIDIYSGKYHEIKRLIASTSNRVEELERIKINNINLFDLNLKEGEWSFLNKKLINI